MEVATSTRTDRAHKRLIRLTAADLSQEKIRITGHRDFFPEDCVGASNRKRGRGKPLEIWLDGLNKLEHTDLPVRADTGTLKGIFRGRSWVGQFFRHHALEPGDIIELERLAERG